MERHIRLFLNKVSFAAISIATITLLFLILQTPQTCIDPHTQNLKPHQKFPKSSCDAAHRPILSLHKRNRRLWATRFWRNAVNSFIAVFSDLHHLTNSSRVLVVSAGAGQPVAALNSIGISDVTAVELVDSPPLVSRADPHNLPFFDNVFDLGFSAHLDQALFPDRYVGEMERTVKVGGMCVLTVSECGDSEAREIANLFRKSNFVESKNVSLLGGKVTRILMRVTVPS